MNEQMSFSFLSSGLDACVQDKLDECRSPKPVKRPEPVRKEKDQ